MPIFRVLQGEEKYDSMANNRDDGLYRNYLYEIEPKDKEKYESIWVVHREYFDHWTDSWRQHGQYYNVEVEKPTNLERFRIVDEKSCSLSSSWTFWKVLERKTEKIEFDEKR